MMDVQLNEIINYLNIHGYKCLFNEDDESIFIQANISGKDIILKCVFPISFPYTFPKIYIMEESLCEIKPLPHIDNRGFICTFDDNISHPNHKMPNEVVLLSVERAFKIIEDGLDGTNMDDFVDEFKAYWAIDSSLSAYTLFDVNEIPRLLYLYRHKTEFYRGEDKTKLIEYLNIIHQINISDGKIDRCIYLPMDCKWIPPYPRINYEFYSIVKQNNRLFKLYYRFLRDRTKPTVVLFSQVIKSGRCLAGWVHSPAKTPHGFRKGVIEPNLTYLLMQKNDPVLKINVTQIDQRRLFYRGGTGNLNADMKVSVTGCGSIGSYLIQGLTEIGICNFDLIDNDTLSSENVARHTCGVIDIGKNKAIAIKENLIKHFPDISCDAHPNDVYKILRDNIQIFNSCDINFIVVGNRPIENLFIELFNSCVIKKPIIIMWVEPFLLGGHAVVLQHGRYDNSILYDSNGNFRNNVLEDGSVFAKRESGCQSTFFPYSGFEARKFVYSFIDFFNDNFIIEKTRDNILFSWCGKLSWALKEGIPISDKWLGKDDKLQIVKRLG